MTNRSAALAVSALALLAAGQALADDPKRIATHGRWESYAYSEQGSKVCYAAALASKTTGGDKGRAATALIVSHRPAAKSFGEVSVQGAYGFKKDSEVEIQAGTSKFNLFTKGDRAWAKDAAADKAIIAALAKAKELTLHATPAKGSAITDQLVLSGFSEAMADIDKACGGKK